MTTYRKGPWKADGRYVRASDDCYLVKAYACTDRDDNVKLMAAAPDMFEALTKYAAWTSQVPPKDKELAAIRQQMLDAIQKALGNV